MYVMRSLLKKKIVFRGFLLNICTVEPLNFFIVQPSLEVFVLWSRLTKHLHCGAFLVLSGGIGSSLGLPPPLLETC